MNNLFETVKIFKWPHKEAPTEESVAREMERLGYKVYDLQTIPPWFERSRHAHDYDEIRGAVAGVTTFHFDAGPVTIEAGDILLIPGGIPHAVQTHNDKPFTAYKGSTSGVRSVTELGDGKGSLENLQQQK
ncbi:MAG: cupin domain-containing protein [Betaproteobacteria bacterium]|nr:cupin domain-containing protein [Betaproteobacteria bacterium]